MIAAACPLAVGDRVVALGPTIDDLGIGEIVEVCERWRGALIVSESSERTYRVYWYGIDSTGDNWRACDLRRIV